MHALIKAIPEPSAQQAVSSLKQAIRGYLYTAVRHSKRSVTQRRLRAQLPAVKSLGSRPIRQKLPEKNIDLLRVHAYRPVGLGCRRAGNGKPNI